MQQKTIALVKGDGSGPEMMAVACAIAVKAAKLDGMDIVFEETPMGWNTYEKSGDTFPPESFKRALELGTIFFGGVGDPKFDNTIGKEKPAMKPEARCLLPLRKRMGLLLNFRPVIYYAALANLAKVKLVKMPEKGIEQVFIRFLLQDSYFGTDDLAEAIDAETRSILGIKSKKDVTGDEELVTDLAYYRGDTIRKYVRAAFEYAKLKNLPLMSVDKANVAARYDYWRKITTKIGAEEYPEIKLSHQYVDSANALLFTPAKLHGVIACGNEHGDILSDGAAEAMGSMGMMCSSSINPDSGAALFESGAGTVPELAGKDKANPLGRILTGAMMLRHLGAKKGAKAIEFAVKYTLQCGFRTADLCPPGKSIIKGKKLGTKAMGDRVISNL
jgi:3-isopropylmalate dehydrogenase